MSTQSSSTLTSGLQAIKHHSKAILLVCLLLLFPLLFIVGIEQLFSVTAPTSLTIGSSDTQSISANELDSLLAKRKQDAYLYLTLIFGFLIGLAYWVNNQKNWQHKYFQQQRVTAQRDLFSDTIVHEFRAPLTAIKGYASFLQESQTLSSEEKRYIHTISSATERLISTLNDFAEITKIQSTPSSLDISRFDVRDMLAQTVQTITEQARHAGSELIYTRPIAVQTISSDQSLCLRICTIIIRHYSGQVADDTLVISSEATRAGILITIDAPAVLPEHTNKLRHLYFTQLMNMARGKFEATALGQSGTRVTLLFPSL